MLRLESHPRHARGEQSFTCKCHSAIYGARVVLYANPPLQQRKHNVSLLDTLSRHSLAQARAEHEPSEHGCQHTTLLPHNLAIPTEALPRLLTTFDHLIACLDLLPCMTPSFSRDRLVVQHGLLHARHAEETSHTCCPRRHKPKPSADVAGNCKVSSGGVVPFLVV
jgi:hypothetical protein